MEKSLNANSVSNIRKTLKKNRPSKSSLDEAVLKHFDVFNLPSKNMRNSPQSSMVRNTFNHKYPSQQLQKNRLKVKKTKKPNLKDLVNRHHRYSASYFSSNITPNKSKCGSIMAFDDDEEIKKYKFVYQIGFGGFGKVWKIMNKKTSKQFAMKQISKSKVIEKQNVESIMNQKCILSSISHPFLINMHSSFQDQQNLYLTMDYLRGADLRYHICYKQKFTEKQIKFIVACIIIGLEYTHENNIIHRDIKPENIVFQETGYARVTDFGIAKVQNSSALPHKFQSSGTPGYMAPQILCKMPYSFQSDFFALGVIIYELILNRRPYEGKNRNQIRQNIINDQAELFQQELPKGFNKNIINFVNGLLQRNPSERLGQSGVQQIKSHKWLKDIKWKALQKKQLIPPFKPNVICETKQYLEQIVMYNQMNASQQNIPKLSALDQTKFEGYEYKKIARQKMKTQKYVKNRDPNHLSSLNSTKMIKTSTNNLSTLLKKQPSMKKQRRNSQDCLVS